MGSAGGTTDGPLIRFHNCHVLRDGQGLKDGQLWIRNGRIVDEEKMFFGEKKSPDISIDCHGNILAPGLIDLQVNGGWGVDFTSMMESGESITDGLRVVARELVKRGVTSFCPTIITTESERYRELFCNHPTLEKWRYFSNNLGYHLEGPFISPDKAGCHPKEHIRRYDAGISDVYNVYGGSLQNVSIITLAPELRNTAEVVRHLTEKDGIVVSLGHTNASLGECEAAVTAGASFVTHLFNAMMSFHHRDPGPLGLLTSKYVPPHRFHYGIIADGIHTHPAALRVAHRTNASAMVLVSDGVFAMGLPEGDHTFFGQTVTCKGHQATLKGTDRLAGSISTIDHCMKHLLRNTSCGIVGAIEAASLRPAEVLGLSHKKGRFVEGADADLVLLDWDLNVLQTYLAGQIVHGGGHDDTTP